MLLFEQHKYFYNMQARRYIFQTEETETGTTQPEEQRTAIYF